MDSLIIQLDISNKRAVFTDAKAIGAFTTVAISLYNFKAAPDTATLKAVIYSDSGIALSTCGTFVKDDNSDRYDATLSLATDTAVAYFNAKAPGFQKDLSLVVTDTNALYCNSSLTVKNNPNAVPGQPLPVGMAFVMVSNLGFTATIAEELEVFEITDQSNAGQVRRALATLVKKLKTKGVV